MSGKIFMPLEMDKETWTIADKMFFLNGALEKVLTDKERDRVVEIRRLNRYDSLKYEYEQEKVETFVNQVIRFLAESLERYHGAGFSFEYWQKFLYVWVKQYCMAGYYVIELFEEIKRQTNGQAIETAIYRPEKKAHCFIADIYSLPWYYDWMTSIGKKMIDFKINYYDRGKSNNVIVNNTEAVESNWKKRGGGFFNKIKKISVEKIKYKIYSHRPKKDVYVLSGASYFNEYEAMQLVILSKGRIQHLDFKYEPKSRDIDYKYRNFLKGKIQKELKVSELWMEIIRDIIIDDFPAFYIEQYKEYYEASIKFLRQYPHLKFIKLITEMYSLNPVMFLSHLAREVKQIKIAELQHGGNYGIQKNILWYAERVVDVFYGWGAWADTRKNLIVCKQGPSEKLHKYDAVNKKEEIVLYVGTAIPVNINWYFTPTAIFDGERYIAWQVEFLENLGVDNRKKIILKNYYVDFGWHIDEIIKRKFPDIKHAGAYNWREWGSMNPGLRDSEFSGLLVNCKIFICDHLSTTWLEALKVDKPILLFYPQDQYAYEESEIPFVQMMEAAEIIVHSPQRAAEIVKMMSVDDAWWKDAERQRVVSIIKERYISQEKDVVGWWAKELLNIAKEV